MQYTVYSLLKKQEHCMFQQSFKKCSGTLAKPKNTENMTFEYDLGNFVYDSI